MIGKIFAYFPAKLLLLGLVGLLGACALGQGKIRSVSEPSTEAILAHRRNISNGEIALNEILKSVDREDLFPISARFRELEVDWIINLAKAPGVSDKSLLNKNVNEFAVVFGMGPAPFTTTISTFRLFVRGDKVIAIGFATNTVPGFRERTKQ